jgi:nucleoside-diphosphate kinase
VTTQPAVQQEHTVALIKPDAFQRGLIGEILTRIEEAGFEIVTISIRKFTRDSARQFYGRQHEGQPYFEALLDFMTSGQHVRLLLKREAAIAQWRRLMGPWKPKERELAYVMVRGEMRSTIRGYFMEPEDTMRNLVHGSDSPEAVLHEARALGWHPGVWA